MAQSLVKPIQRDSTQRIIQCPKCQTKFAVAQSTIEAIAFPRFHCSRCDHVFALEETGLQQPLSKPALVTPAEEEASGQHGDVAAEVFENNERVEDEIEEMTSEEAALDAPEIEEPFDIDAESDFSSSPAAREQSFSEPLSFKSSAAPRRESTPALQIPRYEGSVQSSAPHESEHVPTFNASLTSAEHASDLAGLKEERSLASGGSALDRYIPSSAPMLAETTKHASPDLRDPLSSPAIARELAAARSPSRWASFSYVIAPIACCLMTFAAISMYVRSGGTKLAARATQFLPPAPRLAPGGLHVMSTRYRKVTLDSGETVRIISGMLLNQSEEAFRDIEVEAIAFDAAGQPLERNRVNAASTLAHARLKSLTPEVIQTLQSGRLSASARRFVLKPGEKQEFSIALLGEHAAKAKFFSARVYSVKEARQS